MAIESENKPIDQAMNELYEFINEPPEYEEKTMVREYRHQIFPKLENLRKALTTLKAELLKREWISVEGRLPEPEEFRILVRLQHGLVVIAHYFDNSGTNFPAKGWNYEGMHPANYKMTDWMPLPEPPTV